MMSLKVRIGESSEGESENEGVRGRLTHDE